LSATQIAGFKVIVVGQNTETDFLSDVHEKLLHPAPYQRHLQSVLHTLVANREAEAVMIIQIVNSMVWSHLVWNHLQLDPKSDVLAFKRIKTPVAVDGLHMHRE
jgi:hypothetical protein